MSEMTEAGMVAAEGSEANGIKTSEGVGEVAGVDVGVETSDRHCQFTIMIWIRQARTKSGHARPGPSFVPEGFHFYEKDTKSSRACWRYNSCYNRHSAAALTRRSGTRP